MAINTLHKYSSEEAVNLKVYEEYKWEVKTADGVENDYADWTANPAKSITVYATGTGDDNAVEVKLTCKGASGTAIVLESEDFPLIIEGLLIERVSIKGTDDDFAILSLH